MQFSVSPYSYKEELNKKASQQIDQVRKQKDNNIASLSSSAWQYARNMTSTKKNISESSYLSFASGGFGIGLIVGIFVCVANGDDIDARIHFSNSIGAALAFWFLFGVIGAVLGIIFCGVVIATKKNSNKNIDSRIDAAYCSTGQRIGFEERKCEEIVAQITVETNKQYQTYLDGFHAEAQKMSMHFLESPLIMEVIEWMIGGFYEMIDSADRRRHIQQVSVPFAFRTYNNKITCNLGSYDFEIQRREKLQTPLEQTALAMAIASAIQRKIAYKYPRDVRDKDIELHTFYAYHEWDNVIATVTYTAANDDYEEIHSW